MLVANIDGASRGNPGEAAYGVRVCDADGNEVATIGGYLGRQTNNHAEYQGLIAALQWARENGIAALEVRSDSQLLVRQMQGAYRVKSPGLRPLFEQATALVRGLESFRIVHVRREGNVEADSLANEVLDQQTSKA